MNEVVEGHWTAAGLGTRPRRLPRGFFPGEGRQGVKMRSLELTRLVVCI